MKHTVLIINRLFAFQTLREHLDLHLMIFWSKISEKIQCSKFGKNSTMNWAIHWIIVINAANVNLCNLNSISCTIITWSCSVITCHFQIFWIIDIISTRWQPPLQFCRISFLEPSSYKCHVIKMRKISRRNQSNVNRKTSLQT